MVMRTWTSGFDPERLDELNRFAIERSAPMFRSFTGCLGFIFAVNGETWTTTTLWATNDDILEAENTAVYKATVKDILAAGFLNGRQSTEVSVVEHLELPA